MKHSNQHKGFTLVEIMIVVVIIGILAAIAIPTFSVIRYQSRLKAVTNNLRQICSAAQQYMLDKGMTQAGYTDIAGTSTDDYLHNITPIAGEDYSGVLIYQTTTQVTISDASVTASYNL